MNGRTRDKRRCGTRRERLTNWLWPVRGRRGIRILCAGAKLAQTLRAASLVSCKSGTIAAAWHPRRVASPADFERFRGYGWSSGTKETLRPLTLRLRDSPDVIARPRVFTRVGFSPPFFLWKTVKTKAPWYRSASEDICRQETWRARVTVTQKILHGRMDKDFCRKYKKMRCGLLHLLLIVGGKFHYTVLSSMGEGGFSSDLDASPIIAPARRSPTTSNLRTEEPSKWIFYRWYESSGGRGRKHFSG